MLEDITPQPQYKKSSAYGPFHFMQIVMVISSCKTTPTHATPQNHSLIKMDIKSRKSRKFYTTQFGDTLQPQNYHNKRGHIQASGVRIGQAKTKAIGRREKEEVESALNVYLF